MRKLTRISIYLVFLAILVGACVPPTFISPVQIHITPGDEIERVHIAVDAVGRKHIAGVVDDRIVYYRTDLGEQELALTMTMSGTGDNWLQYSPDIAVTDGGDAYLVWVEQRGDTDKFACYRDVPATAPDGGYQTACLPLDGEQETWGLVRVVGRGDVVYAVYDRFTEEDDTPLYYQELTGTTTGLVVEYPIYIHQMDLAIDSNGKLHIAYIDERTVPPIFALWYRSNAQTTGDDMNQVWRIVPAWELDHTVAPSITFHKLDGPEAVAIASVWELGSGGHLINLQYCKASDCSVKDGLNTLPLPYTDWDIREVKILGGKFVSESYAISFIASNSSDSDDQVWYWAAPFSGSPIQVTDNSHEKYDLAMVDGGIPIMGFLEKWTVLSTHWDRVAIYDPAAELREISASICTSDTFGAGDMAANPRSTTGTLPVAGVWNVCGKTWFSTNAEVEEPTQDIYLPLIVN